MPMADSCSSLAAGAAANTNSITRRTWRWTPRETSTFATGRTARVQAFDADGRYITTFIGDAQELSKWQSEYVRSNPDVYKARRRVYSLEPEWRFALPAGVAFDAAGSRLMVADTQRWRIQIYNKVLDYSEPQFNI